MPVGRPPRAPHDPHRPAPRRVPSVGFCIDCGAPSDLDPCLDCHVERHPTALSELVEDERTTLAALADETGIPIRTLRRAHAGEPLAAASAERLAQALRLNLERLRQQGRQGDCR